MVTIFGRDTGPLTDPKFYAPSNLADLDMWRAGAGRVKDVVYDSMWDGFKYILYDALAYSAKEAAKATYVKILEMKLRYKILLGIFLMLLYVIFIQTKVNQLRLMEEASTDPSLLFNL